MTAPTINTIQDRLGRILEHEHGDDQVHSKAQEIRLLIKTCSGHAGIEATLAKINTILRGYGVESIRDKGHDRYFQDIGILYINMGETYCSTIMYDTRKNKWIVSSFGELVERQSRRFDL